MAAIAGSASAHAHANWNQRTQLAGPSEKEPTEKESELWRGPVSYGSALSYKEALNLSSPLLLFAQTAPFDLESSHLLSLNPRYKAKLKYFVDDAIFRIIQANLTLRNWFVCTSINECIRNISKIFTIESRQHIFSKIMEFDIKDAKSSYWLLSNAYDKLPARLLSIDEIITESNLFSYERRLVNSLHNMVWLGVQILWMNRSEKSKSILPQVFNCQSFSFLPISYPNLTTCEVETLCKLDLDTFLYLSVYSYYSNIKDYKSEEPVMLLADAMPLLPVEKQLKFWTAAQKLSKNELNNDISDLKSVLVNGIERIRLIGPHEFDLDLMIVVARTFESHAKNALENYDSELVSMMEDRALLYWTNIIKRLENPLLNQMKEQSLSALFPHHSESTINRLDNVNELLEEGQFFVAYKMMRNKDYHNAIDAFKSFRSPYAAFNEAIIYKCLASNEINNCESDLLTSDMRTKHAMWLMKAKEALNAVMERINNNSKHPLSAQVDSMSVEIEGQLIRYSKDTADGGHSDSIPSSVNSADDINYSFNYPIKTSLHSTSRNADLCPNTPRSAVNYPLSSNPHKIDLSELISVSSQSLEIVEKLSKRVENIQEKLNSFLRIAENSSENIAKIEKKLRQDPNSFQQCNTFRNRPQLSNSGVYNRLPMPNKSLFQPANFSMPNLPLLPPGYFLPGMNQLVPTHIPFFAPNSSLPPEMQPYLFFPNACTPNLPIPASTSTNSSIAPNTAQLQSNIPTIIDAAGASAQILSEFPQNSNSHLTHVIPVPNPVATFKSDFMVPDVKSPFPLNSFIPPQLGVQELGAIPLLNSIIPKPIIEPTSASSNLLRLNSNELQIDKTHSPFQPKAFKGIAPGGTSTPVKPKSDAITTLGLNFNSPSVLSSYGTVSKDVPENIKGSKTLLNLLTKPTVLSNSSTSSVPSLPSLGSNLNSQSVVSSHGTVYKDVPENTKGSKTLLDLLSKPSVLSNSPASSVSSLQLPSSNLNSQSVVSSHGMVNKDAPKNTKGSNSSASLVPSPVTSVDYKKSSNSPSFLKTVPITNAAPVEIFTAPLPGKSSFKFEHTLLNGNMNLNVQNPFNSSCNKDSKPFTPNTEIPSSNENQRVPDSGENEEDFVPTVEFQPVIALPDLVEVKTGEESLIILYEERCKLLRFDSTLKEWKERGIGKMKILHDPIHGSVRLLMRREQVHKVCCNQNLIKELVIKPVVSSDKAWSWSGIDFSEGTEKVETFAVRFKNVDLAKTFFSAVENAKNLIGSKTTVSQSINEDSSEVNGVIKSDAVKPLSELFKPEAGSWECKSCYTRNSEEKLKCLACETSKPSQPAVNEKPSLDSNVIQLKSNTSSFNFSLSKKTSEAFQLSDSLSASPPKSFLNQNVAPLGSSTDKFIFSVPKCIANKTLPSFASISTTQNSSEISSSHSGSIADGFRNGSCSAFISPKVPEKDSTSDIKSFPSFVFNKPEVSGNLPKFLGSQHFSSGFKKPSISVESVKTNSPLNLSDEKKVDSVNGFNFNALSLKSGANEAKSNSEAELNSPNSNTAAPLAFSASLKQIEKQ